jgi:hypothetical protein
MMFTLKVFKRFITGFASLEQLLRKTPWSKDGYYFVSVGLFVETISFLSEIVGRTHSS